MKNNQELAQLNARIPKGLHRNLKTIAAQTGLKMEVLALDAFRWYYGIEDAQAKHRRKQVLQAVETLHPEGLPFFDMPLAPSNNFAGEQILENLHNGIVGVAGSIPVGSTTKMRTNLTTGVASNDKPSLPVLSSESNHDRNQKRAQCL